jgi:hypothetical protein
MTSKCCRSRRGYSPRSTFRNVAAYWQRLQQRGGYKRAVAAEELAGERQKVAPRLGA